MRAARIIPFENFASRRYSAVEQPCLVAQIGHDEELLRLRASIIGSAGFCVHSMTPNQIPAELHHGQGSWGAGSRGQGSRVWIFCHTLENYELTLLVTAIRQVRPADKLLRLTGLNAVKPARGLFDGLLASVGSVDSLIQTVAELAKS